MPHLPQNCSIHPPIGPEKLKRGQPDEGARVEEGIISPSRNTLLSARQGDGTSGDGSRHSREPLATEYSQSRSRIPEEVQGMGSRSGPVKGDCNCDAEGRPGRRGVLTPIKSIVEVPAEIVKTQAKSVSVESISSEFVELTPPALAEGASSLPADSVVAASGRPLVDTSFDPIHATRIEIIAAKEEKEERLGNSAQVLQPTRISELQPTETPKQFAREPASVVGGPLGKQGTLTALPGGRAATPQKIPRFLPEFLADPVLVSPKPPVDQHSVLHLGESIDEPVTRHLPTELITMEPVTEPVAETATKPDIGSVSDIVSGPVTEPTVEVYITSSALQQRVADIVQPTVSSTLNVLDIRIPRTSSPSVAPAVASPHIRLGESVGPVPQKKTSEPEPSPIVSPSGSVGIETALQVPLPFSRPSPHFAIGFLRNPSVSKLLRSLKRRVLSKKSREDKTPNLLPVPPSPVRPSLGDTAPTQTNTPLPLSSVNDLSSLDDDGEPPIPTEDSIEDSRGDWKSLPMPSPNPSVPPTMHSKQTSQGLQSHHSATQVAYRRAVALRALELQQIREDEREVVRLRGGGCCGGGGGKSIDPTPHQAGTGLPLPTEKPPVAPPPLVAPRTPKPGEPPQGDPSRSRAQSHASQRTNKPGAESRSRRGSQATMKEAASVSRQPSQREIRSRTASQAEPRSRKQSRVGEPGASSQTRGARSRTTSKAPGVPPLPSAS